MSHDELLLIVIWVNMAVYATAREEVRMVESLAAMDCMTCKAGMLG